MVEIGQLRVREKHEKAAQVVRKLRVTAMTNCKVLYMTSKAFLNIFGKYELVKLKEFCETVDLDDIRERIRLFWK